MAAWPGRSDQAKSAVLKAAGPPTGAPVGKVVGAQADRAPTARPRTRAAGARGRIDMGLPPEIRTALGGGGAGNDRGPVAGVRRSTYRPSDNATPTDKVAPSGPGTDKARKKREKIRRAIARRQSGIRS